MIYYLIIFISGIILGFLIGYLLITKQLKDKLRVGQIITEDHIKIIFNSMGRTPTQKQLNIIMNNLKKVK